jgi:hypothetical protein
MRVTAWTAAFLLTAGIVSTAGLMMPANANPAKVICPCVCPQQHRIVSHAVIHPVVPHHVARHVRHEEYAESDYYSYESASRVDQHEWHGEWQAAPDETPPPPAYAAGGYYEGMQVEGGGWTGGVGYAAEADGGFVDGFGQAHFAGGGFANGPTFNSFNQSFVPNPSVPGPFRGRTMGGPAMGGQAMGGFAPGRAR